MISDKRYRVWLEEIALLRDMSVPLDRRDRMLLEMMEREAEEFEHAYPQKAAEVRASMKELVS
jgi:hypothetical protein